VIFSGLSLPLCMLHLCVCCIPVIEMCVGSSILMVDLDPLCSRPGSHVKWTSRKRLIFSFLSIIVFM
jgi:hypothetical protein